MNSHSAYDELDMAIDHMQACDSKPTADESLPPEVLDLVQVARDLAAMPRADFRSRLLLELEWQAAGREIANAHKPCELKLHSGTSIDFMPTLLEKANGLYPFRGRNLVVSAALHASLFLLLGSGLVMVSGTARIAPFDKSQTAELYTTESIYMPHGGGGSGASEMTGASRGEAPRFADEQFAPPRIAPVESRLPVEDTVIGPPDLNIPKVTQEGDPLSTLLASSSGVGVRGIGPGEGDGAGSGHGPGSGPGSGGGPGNGYLLPGRSVTPPRLIYKPEPEYSDEAREMKYQGIVTLSVVVDTDGRTKRVEVVHSLGMGLDEKAVEAVRTWRFEPGMKEGHPVPTQVTVDVDFRLF